jgi:HSP20 family protein
MKATLQKEPRAEPQASRVEYLVPVVNIHETKSEYILEAEMPGVSKEGLEVTLEGNELAIQGRRTPEKTGGNPLLRERSAAAFRRVFELDPTVDASNISAKIEQGLLTVALPKSRHLQPRRISVSD